MSQGGETEFRRETRFQVIRLGVVGVFDAVANLWVEGIGGVSPPRAHKGRAGRIVAVDSRPTPSRGQALRGNDRQGDWDCVDGESSDGHWESASHFWRGGGWV